MAGDPIYDTNSTTTPTWTNIHEGATSTTATYYEDDSYSVTYTIVRRVEEDVEKIKKLIKQQVIEDMKDTWHNLKKQFRPAPPVRPAIQLRGVCFGGRGWA